MPMTTTKTVTSPLSPLLHNRSRGTWRRLRGSSQASLPRCSVLGGLRMMRRCSRRGCCALSPGRVGGRHLFSDLLLDVRVTDLASTEGARLELLKSKAAHAEDVVKCLTLSTDQRTTDDIISIIASLSTSSPKAGKRLATAGLGTALLPTLLSLCKGSARSDDDVAEILSILVEIAPHDPKLHVGVRLGGGPVLGFLANATRLRPTNNTRLIALALGSLLALSKPAANSVSVNKFGAVSYALAIMTTMDAFKSTELVSAAIKLVYVVLQAPEVAQAHLQKGIVKALLAVYADWTAIDSK